MSLGVDVSKSIGINSIGAISGRSDDALAATFQAQVQAKNFSSPCGCLPLKFATSTAILGGYLDAMFGQSCRFMVFASLDINDAAFVLEAKTLMLKPGVGWLAPGFMIHAAVENGISSRVDGWWTVR